MSASKMQGRDARQSGMALVTALIMLVVLTLLVLAGINMTNVNTKVAYNMQLRDEAQAATQQAIEQMISAAANFNSPLPPLQTIGVDLDNDGTADYTVNVPTPVCVASTQLDGETAQTLEAVGVGRGITRERVRQLESRA